MSVSNTGAPITWEGQTCPACVQGPACAMAAGCFVAAMRANKTAEFFDAMGKRQEAAAKAGEPKRLIPLPDTR